MDIAEILATIDYSQVMPWLREDEVVGACRDAIELGVNSVHVYPCHMAAAVATLKGSRVKPGGPVGYPHGTHSTRTKIAEAEEVVGLGSKEVDVVINIGALRAGDDAYVRDELTAVVKAAGGNEVKVILEVCYLTDEEKVRGAELAIAAGAQFVKTSTGYGDISLYHSVQDTQLLVDKVGDRIGVKMSDGFFKPEDYVIPVRCLEIGARRLGLSPELVQILIEKLG